MTHQATSTFIPRHIRRDQGLSAKLHYWASCSCGADVGFRLVDEHGRLSTRAHVARLVQSVRERNAHCPALPLAVAEAFNRTLASRGEGAA